jgi:hypothetical protein
MPPQLLPSSLTQLMISSGLRRDFEVDRIDVGEALEQHRLAFHHGLAASAPRLPAQDGRAVGDDGDELPLVV